MKWTFRNYMREQVFQNRTLNKVEKATLLITVPFYWFYKWTNHHTVNRLVGRVRGLVSSERGIKLLDSARIGEVYRMSWRSFGGDQHVFYVRKISQDEYERAVEEAEC
jgi:hypothetical protein